jgi:lipopolysaccharide export system protein LptA
MSPSPSQAKFQENLNRMFRRFFFAAAPSTFLLAALVVASPSTFAAPAQPTVPLAPKSAAGAGSFQYKADRISLTPNGVRLEGNAQIASPQLEVRAAAIAFDFKQNQITQVRADSKVNIKVNFVPKGGGEPTRVEATSNSATLDPATRTLILKGNVDGFYQEPGGARTTFAGTQATLVQKAGFTDAEIVGPVKITVPPEATSGEKGAAALGTVIITSRDAKLDQKAGVFRLVGNAHAVSIDGPNKFDVSAPEMVLARGKDNTINTLNTIGRTSLKIDLPPDAATPDATAGTVNGNKIGKPTRVEVESDKATVDRATNTLTFEGNVTGFYYLSPAAGEPQKYDFSGTKAVISYIPDKAATKENPAGLKADITGTPNRPVEVSTPSLNLDFGG